MSEAPHIQERLNARIARANESLNPIDFKTGLRVYNPDGVPVVNINELLETNHDEADSDRRPDRSNPAEGRGPRGEAEEDHVDRAHRGCPDAVSRGAGTIARAPDGAAEGDEVAVAHGTKHTADDLGFIQIADAKILAAVARGDLDLNAEARRELAARGLDHYGKWVGFEKAARIAEEGA